MLELKVKKLDPNAILPTKASPLEAGWDLYALRPGQRIEPRGMGVIYTGLAFEIPSGYFGLVCDRSSHGRRGLKVLGGVIDSTYRGELLILFANLTHEWREILAGEKAAQILILPVPQVGVREVTELTDSVRGDKGFGQLSGR